MLKMLKRGARLLVLDDDPSMQKLVGTLLRRAGYRTDVVSQGQQAIEKIGQNDYAALLLDLMAPTEGGLTVIKHLRETRPELLKRVVLVTASPESVLRGIDKDVAAIVRKPFEANELIETISRVLSQ
ncbi:MAG TPA: response regulator [Thermoanaerobaculia bacterium]|nr:response regulator [Thermoanaerobaculia bacterium]